MAVGESARGLPVDRERFMAGVEHDKIVAEPVHLTEADPAHVAAYMAEVALWISAAFRHIPSNSAGLLVPQCSQDYVKCPDFVQRVGQIWDREPRGWLSSASRRNPQLWRALRWGASVCQEVSG